ncbi:hypothetical protein EJ06DRAFT_522528 [Trichodelitschia bisporula]|uniref:Uncharacterized protein n=1 Tax=Trichodelitschia bisporula TaxID=703511 RepID=A0A6G1HVD1_9PEZI|nr:hypothetical protein EJ06DRAFT_522528 [Trichodelitschia bisporula]
MAGRKRSHDDAAPDLDDEAPAAPVSSPDAPAAATKVVTSRPHLPTRKSQRMSTAASPTATSVDEPIDPAALALGLGWARRDPSSSDSSLSAQDTFIKNHFPNMRSPRITLYNRGLGYAVVLSAPHTPLERAHWWLFDLDLKRARFLCEADGGEEGELLARLGNKDFESGADAFCEADCYSCADDDDNDDDDGGDDGGAEDEAGVDDAIVCATRQRRMCGGGCGNHVTLDGSIVWSYAPRFRFTSDESGAIRSQLLRSRMVSARAVPWVPYGAGSDNCEIGGVKRLE